MAERMAGDVAPDTAVGGESLAQLRASERRYRDLAEAGSDWLWEMDEDLRFTYVSAAIERFTGFSPKYYVGKTRFDVAIPEIDPEMWDEHRTLLARHLPFKDFTFPSIDRHGRIRHMLISGKPTFDEDGCFRGYRGVGHDITVEVESLRRAEEAEYRLSAALEVIPDEFVIYDADERLVTRNGQHLSQNADVADVLAPGRSIEEILRDLVQRGHHPEAEGREEAWVSERLQRFRNPGLPFELKLASGRWLRVAEAKTEDGETVGIRTDITEMKRREQELERSEERYRTLAEGSIQGILVHRTLVPLYLNRAFADLFGYSVDELFAMESLRGLIAPEDRARLEGYSVARLRGERVPSRFEFRGIRKDGSPVWLSQMAQITEWEGEKASQTTVIDITDRKIAQSALERSEKRLREIAENSIQGIMVHRNFKVIYSNRRFAELHGYTRREFYALDSLLMTVTAEERARIQKYQSARLRGEEAPTHFEVQGVRKDGSHFWLDQIVQQIDWDGEPTTLITSVDVTERHRAQEELKQREQQLRQAQHLGQMGHWVWHLEDGRFDVSPEWRRIHQFRPDEPVYLDALVDMMHPDDREAAAQSRNAAIAARRAYEFSFRFLRRDGKERFIEGRASPNLNTEGELQAYFGITQDVTARKLAEAALARHTEQQQVIIAFGERALVCADLDKLLQDAGEVVAKALKVELTDVLELLPGGETFRIRAGVGWHSGVVGTLTLPNDPQLPIGHALRTKEVVVIDNIVTQTKFKYSKALLDHGVVSGAAVRIPGEEGALGALCAFSTSLRHFDRNDCRFLEALASLLGSALLRLRSEEELRRSEADQRRLSRRLGTLSRRLMGVREEDRRNLARVLHDDLGQSITALKINLQGLQRAKPDNASPLIANGLDIADHMLEQIRDLASSLRPPMLDELGLVATLEWLASRLFKQAGMNVRLNLCQVMVRLPRTIETACFRIAQEALTNVMRHSGTLEAEVQLDLSEDEILLMIADRGVGFDFEQQQVSETLADSFGINGMQEQASFVGGALMIRSSPRAGTRVVARIPIAA